MRHQVPRHLLPLVLPVLLLLCGCSTYDSLYQFRPRPVVATVRVTQTEQVAARVLVSVVGVRNAKDGRPEEIEARLRVENLAAEEVALAPDHLRLVTAGLDEMRVRTATPVGGVRTQTGAASELTAYFPFPGDGSADDFDLDGLDLRWTLVVDGKDVVGSASFSRAYEVLYAYPPYPWYGGWYGWGGYGWGGCRW